MPLSACSIWSDLVCHVCGNFGANFVGFSFSAIWFQVFSPWVFTVSCFWFEWLSIVLPQNHSNIG